MPVIIAARPDEKSMLSEASDPDSRTASEESTWLGVHSGFGIEGVWSKV